MDEATIAQNLAANKAHLEAPIVQEVVNDANKITPTTKALDGIKLMDFFGVTRDKFLDRDVQDKMDFLYQWASQETGSEDSVDVMAHLKTLEGRLGLTFRPGSKLEGLYRWVKLDAERRRVEKAMSLI